MIERTLESLDNVFTNIVATVIIGAIVIAIIVILIAIISSANKQYSDNIKKQQEQAELNNYTNNLNYKYSKINYDAKIHIYNVLRNCRDALNTPKDNDTWAENCLIAHSDIEWIVQKYNIQINSDFIDYDINYLESIIYR